MKNKIAVISMALILLVAFAYASSSKFEFEADLFGQWNDKTTEFEIDLDSQGVNVNEVRLYVFDLDGVQCRDIPGWDVMQINDYPDRNMGAADLCWYFTDEGFRGVETFLFSANTPSDKSPVLMRFELRENGGDTGKITSIVQEYDWAQDIQPLEVVQQQETVNEQEQETESNETLEPEAPGNETVETNETTKLPAVDDSPINESEKSADSGNVYGINVTLEEVDLNAS